MSIMPEGERVKNAVRWIAGCLHEDPSQAIMGLVHQAISRFDLSPKEGEELMHFYRSARDQRDDSPS